MTQKKSPNPYKNAGKQRSTSSAWSKTTVCNLRSETSKAIFAVLERGESLRECLPTHQKSFSEQDKAWMQEMVFGVMRKLPLLQYWLRQLLDKPLKGKTKIVESLLILGFYQIAFSRVPSHAAVSESVEATTKLGNASLKGLVNGVLRRFIREDIAATEPSEAFIQAGLPKWLYKRLAKSDEATLASIIAGIHEKPPLWLRVNRTQIEKAAFIEHLNEAGYESQISTTTSHPDAVIFNKSMNVMQLPGFAQGWFSVQDGAAQLAATFLAPEPSERILDACCAPGGKTSHLLERQPALNAVIAVDNDAKRLQRVSENLNRLQLKAEVVCADLQSTDDWYDGEQFDKILLDAPCSATGVIRRHPDIMWLRKSTDIATLVHLQQTILRSLWSVLKPGGTLLYATCSILEEENQAQIRQFLADQNDCVLSPIIDSETTAQPGRQILPGENGMDGFYYARLVKSQR